jgi:hypothetical protein
MTFAIKRKNGRPLKTYKLRTFSGVTPSGFEFERVSMKDKALIYKRIK